MLIVACEQVATGTRSTCHRSCACGKTLHVVSPVQRALAGHWQTTVPPSAYRHSKPATHPPADARRPEPTLASGKLSSDTWSPMCVTVVKTVTADTATAVVVVAGDSVLRPRAKPGGYTTPAAKHPTDPSQSFRPELAEAG